MNRLMQNKKYITTAELKKMGYSYYKIGNLEKEGYLHRVNKSTYESLIYKGDENDFFNAEAYVPSGVICLMSAARYYELTNFLPDSVDVAIERKKKVITLADWPEKTVVDIIYYRNKIGIEETSEVLRNYLKRKDRNTDKLFTYAKQLRCEKIVRTYLEVLM